MLCLSQALTPSVTKRFPQRMSLNRRRSMTQLIRGPSSRPTVANGKLATSAGLDVQGIDASRFEHGGYEHASRRRAQHPYDAVA